MKSPHKIQMPGQQAQGTTRLQGVVANQIDTGFIKVAQDGLTRMQAAEEKARKEQLDFIKTSTDNAAENDVIQANAELAQIDGLNAMEKSTMLREKLQRSFEKRREAIQPQFQPFVDQIFEKKLTRYNKFAIPYTLGQVKKVKDEANKTFLANAINEAVEESGDQDFFSSEGLGKVVYAAQKAAAARYGAHPELVDTAARTAVSTAIMRAVEQQAFIGRMDKAQELMDLRSDDMLPSDRVKAIKLMDQARADLGDKEASDLAMQAAANYPDDIEKQVVWLNGASRNDRVQHAATAFAQMQFKVAKQAQEAKIEKTHASINQAMARGENPQQYIMQLPPGEERDKAVERYNKNRGGEAVMTDFKSVDKLKQRLLNVVTPDQIKALPNDLIDSYRDKVHAKDLEPLESLFIKLKGKEGQEYGRIHRMHYKIVDPTVKQWMKENDIMDPVERGRLENAALEETIRQLELNPKIDSQQLNLRILKTLRERGMETKQKDRSWRNIWGLRNRDYQTTAESLAPATPERPGSPRLREMIRQHKNFNDDQIDQVIRLMESRGEDVSKY
jgi:hypothetical protein